MKTILIAGIGNIFLGDDAFGVEVVQELSRRQLPSCVQVKDFGIRSYDLAYELAKEHEAVILVDATPRGETPGSLYLIEPEIDNAGALQAADVDAHSMNSVHVLQLAKSLGGPCQRLYLVGGEPGDLGGNDGRIGLSETLQAAVPMAVEMIESLVRKLLKSELTTAPSLLPA